MSDITIHISEEDHELLAHIIGLRLAVLEKHIKKRKLLAEVAEIDDNNKARRLHEKAVRNNTRKADAIWAMLDRLNQYACIKEIVEADLAMPDPTAGENDE